MFYIKETSSQVIPPASFYAPQVLPMSNVIKLSFLPSFPLAEGRVVQHSVDRVGKYACDINANALAQMHGGVDSPRHCFARRPSLCCAERGKTAFFLNLITLPSGF